MEELQGGAPGPSRCLTLKPDAHRGQRSSAAEGLTHYYRSSYPLFLALLFQFVPAEQDEGFIILIPLLQPRSARTRLLSDERINRSIANTIKNKYSYNELCWDSGSQSISSSGDLSMTTACVRACVRVRMLSFTATPQYFIQLKQVNFPSAKIDRFNVSLFPEQ